MDQVISSELPTERVDLRAHEGVEAPVDLTLFPAPARWTTTGERVRLAWVDAVRQVASPELWPGGGAIDQAADTLPGWTFARYRNDSRVPGPGEPPEESALERIQEVTGLVVEYLDDPTIDRDEVVRRWSRWRFLAHTSAFHLKERGEQPPGPRWRVLVPLARPVSAEVAQQLGQWARHARRRAGLVSALTEDPTRWVPVPALSPGGYEWVVGSGEWLDPDACLAELAEWREADRQDRARVVLAGTSLSELVERVAGHPAGSLPWPAALDLGVPLLPGAVVALVSEVPGLRRTLGLILARFVAEAGLPVLCVDTNATLEETLARLLGLADPDRGWRAMADGVADADELRPLAEDLARRAPHLHLVLPGPGERGLDRLAEEWRVLAEATVRDGLVLVEDPVDLGEEGGGLRRSVGLPLRDLAAWRSPAGVGAAVLLVTSPEVARQLPVDVTITVEARRLVAVDSDGAQRELPLAVDPRTGAVRATGPLS